MTRFATPVSSSSVTNVMPLAVPGRCRTSTNPATRTCRPGRAVESSHDRITPSDMSCCRKNDIGCARSDKPAV